MTVSRRLWVWSGALLLLLIAVFAVRVSRHYPGARLELGRAKFIHLEAATEACLRRLPDDVLITYYVSSRLRLPSNLRQMEVALTELLAAMQRASRGKLTYQIVDPEKNPDFSKQAAQGRVAPFRARTVTRDAYQERTVWSSLHLAFGARPPAVINGVDGAMLPRLQSILVEQLNQMAKPRPPVFALAAPEGYEKLAEALAARGRVARVNLESAQPLPPECDVLFWLEPRVVPALARRQVSSLLEAGGSVVIAGSRHRVLVERNSGGTTFAFEPSGSQVENWLATFGLRFLPELVLDSACAQIEVGTNQESLRFLVRCTANNQDFRTFTALPNGDLLFVAPSPFQFMGETLARRGYTPLVLATTSDATTTRTMKYGTVRLGSPELEPGEPAPKLPLMAWLRPNEPSRGSIVALASSSPLQDAYLTSSGFAHQRLLNDLCDTLAANERLVLRRVGMRRFEPLPELGPSQRFFWRLVCVLIVPAGFAVFAWRRKIRYFGGVLASMRRQMTVAIRIAALVTVTLTVVGAGAALGWRHDLSANGVSRLTATTRELARALSSQEPVRARLLFSSPAQLPPLWRPRLRQLQTTLHDLDSAGARVTTTLIHPGELDQPARQQWEQAGVVPFEVASVDDEITTVRTVYASLELAARGRTQWLSFPDPAAFEGLEFRLAFALWRLQTGRRPQVALIGDVPRLSPAEALEDFQKKSLLAPSGTDVFSQARAMLEQAGFSITHVNLRQPTLPPDTDLVVWLQPRRNIRPLLDQVVGFLHRGGNVLIAAQHFSIQSRQYRGASFKMVYWPQPQVPDLDEYYFPKLGLELVREVLFDEANVPSSLQTQVNRAADQRDYLDEVSALPFVVRVATSHFASASPWLHGLGDQALPFPNRWRLDSNRLAALGLRATPLFTTSSRTWTFDWKGGWLPETVLAGPPLDGARHPQWLGLAPLAVLVEGTFPLPARAFAEQTEAPELAPSRPGVAVPNGHLVLLGCSQVFRNERLTDPQFRGDQLLLNLVTGLALPPSLAAIAARRAAPRGLGFVGTDVRLRWRSFVLAAGPVFLLGGGVAWRTWRRRPTSCTSARIS